MARERDEIDRAVEEEIRRRIERGELAQVEDPDAARLARFYEVAPRREERRSWDRKDRPRVDTHPTQEKLRWEVAS